MTVTRNYGGHAVAVYKPGSSKGMKVCKDLFNSERIDFYVPADYSKNSELDKKMKVLLDRMIGKINFEREIYGTKKMKVINASDSTSWKICKRKLWLDKFRPEISYLDDDENEFEELIKQRGLEHEKRVLASLANGKPFVTAESAEHTEELIKKKTPLIYQPQIFDKNVGVFGKPDFLILDDDGQYFAADAKLSLSTDDKKEILAQLGTYRKLLKSDKPAYVYLGNGQVDELAENANKEAEKFLTETREIISQENEPKVYYGNTRCSQCGYQNHCKPVFEAEQNISLLYGIDPRATKGLEDIGIKTITEFSNSIPEKLPDVPYLKGADKKKKAVLQAKAYLAGEFFKIADIKIPEGDLIHFDIEDNPLTSTGQKHVYLWGLLKPPYSDQEFDYIWTNNESEDFEGWTRFLKQIEEYRKQFKKPILVHFSHHEKTTISMYAERYNQMGHQTVQWLLNDESALWLMVCLKDMLCMMKATSQIQKLQD